MSHGEVSTFCDVKNKNVEEVSCNIKTQHKNKMSDILVIHGLNGCFTDSVINILACLLQCQKHNTQTLKNE